jgi:hypothetical protein
VAWAPHPAPAPRPPSPVPALREVSAPNRPGRGAWMESAPPHTGLVLLVTRALRRPGPADPAPLLLFGGREDLRGGSESKDSARAHPRTGGSTNDLWAWVIWPGGFWPCSPAAFAPVVLQPSE